MLRNSYWMNYIVCLIFSRTPQELDFFFCFLFVFLNEFEVKCYKIIFSLICLLNDRENLDFTFTRWIFTSWCCRCEEGPFGATIAKRKLSCFNPESRFLKIWNIGRIRQYCTETYCSYAVPFQSFIIEEEIACQYLMKQVTQQDWKFFL